VKNTVTTNRLIVRTTALMRYCSNLGRTTDRWTDR